MTAQFGLIAGSLMSIIIGVDFETTGHGGAGDGYEARHIRPLLDPLEVRYYVSVSADAHASACEAFEYYNGVLDSLGLSAQLPEHLKTSILPEYKLGNVWAPQ